MPVAELLERTSSAELGEWKAFERAYGPLGSRYGEHKLADIYDAIERLGVVFQLVMGADPDDIEELIPTPRPADVEPYDEDEDQDEDEEDNVEF